MADTDADRAVSLAGYQLRLPAYEGPLDVLLRLIERSRLAIEDVSLVKVTDQFIAFIATMHDAPLETVADFTAIGARLTVLKSRSLLPRPVTIDEAFDESDITVRLRDYKRLKDAAERLGQVHAAGLHTYTAGNRGAIVTPVASRVATLARHEPEQLSRSLRRRLSTLPKPAQVIRQRRIVNLRDVVDRIATLVARERAVRFSGVIGDDTSRTAVATAFLAVLILIRRQALDASQDGLFTEISLGPATSHHSGPNGHVAYGAAEPPSISMNVRLSNGRNHDG